MASHPSGVSTPHVDVIGKLAESALNPIVDVIDEDSVLAISDHLHVSHVLQHSFQEDPL